LVGKENNQIALYPYNPYLPAGLLTYNSKILSAMAFVSNTVNCIEIYTFTWAKNELFIEIWIF
jgi:hypothetical protein